MLYRRLPDKRSRPRNGDEHPPRSPRLIPGEKQPVVQRLGLVLMEETERCTRCGGSGLVLVSDPAEEPSSGHNPSRPSQPG
jgi:hypothetical protein